MTRVDAEVVLALADNNMNVSVTAKALYMHRNNVIYHLRKVKSETGLDPMKFYDLYELIQMIGGNEDGSAQVQPKLSACKRGQVTT